MANKKTAVFGIYTTRESVERAADALVKSGFQSSDISVLLPENLGSKAIGTEKNTKAPEGAATGAGSGAVLGGTLGLLAGIGALAIPGVGPLIAAGPIMAALAGMGIGERSEASQEHWSGWGFRSTRQSVTKVVCKRAESSSPHIATRLKKSNEPRKSCNAREQRMFPQRVRVRLIPKTSSPLAQQIGR